MDLSSYNLNSRVWIYQADRQFTETEKIWVLKQLEIFTQNWASHGSQLKAIAWLPTDFSIALLVDTSVANSSGCSIDKSVHFIKELGKELNVDFFNRLKVWIKDNDSFKRISFKSLGEYPNSIYFNSTIQTLEEFNSNFESHTEEYLKSIV